MTKRIVDWGCPDFADFLLFGIARALTVPEATAGQGSSGFNDGEPIQSGLVMQDYSIQRCTRRCHKTDRPLEPGESFYSVVVSKGSELLRFDYAEIAWDGPPDGAIGWWRGKMPQPSVHSRKPVPDSVLLETLSDLCEQPEESSLAYLLGVLLVRRKVLTQIEEPSPDDGGYMHLKEPEVGSEYWVPCAPPAKDQMEVIQQALSDLIYTYE